MGKRIYFQSSIEELEILVKSNQNNSEKLNLIKEELLHRKSKRAKGLLNTIENNLNQPNGIPKKHQTISESPLNQENEIITPAKTEPIETNNLIIQDIDWDREFDNLIQNNKKLTPTNTEKKPIENKPDDLLHTWTVLEALSPQSYLKPRDLIIGNGEVSPISEDKLPWPLDRSKPNCRLFYTVYLGSLNLSVCTKDLLEVYKDTQEEKHNVSGHAALAAVIVDKNGEPLGIDYSAISSFGWAYSKALSGDLSYLKHWDLVEKKLLEGLDKILQRHDEDGKLLPLTWGVINQAHNWLIKNCGIPLRVTSKPEFAIKRFAPLSIGTPEAPLLNSFYLSDLQSARTLVANNQAGSALSKYLGINKPSAQYDLFNNDGQLKKILEPKNIPNGRWPVKGKFPLVMLQQTAVNIAKRELKNEGLFSVNGPPGTGKTTLLRDVVADVIVDRAIAMSAFNTPEDAFTKTNDVIKSQGNKFYMHKVHESLKGHEILVASSNNKAVENISRELPLIEAIDDSIDLNYFKPLCDSLLNEEDESWGLIATVLGNSKNKTNFANKAWWNKDTSLQSYFQYISGALDYDEDDEGNEIIPSIVKYGLPPENHHEALDNWRIAKAQFEEALKKVREVKNITQESLECHHLIEEYNQNKKDLSRQLKQLTENIHKAQEQLKNLQQSLQNQLAKLEVNKTSLIAHKKSKPAFWKRLFFRSIWKAWKSENKKILKAESLQNQVTLKAKKLVNHQQEEYQNLRSVHSRTQFQLDKINNKIEISQKKIDKANRFCEKKLIMDESLNIPHKERQLLSPTLTKEAHEFRDELFVLAIKLHKAFIDAAYRPISQNILGFMRVLGNKKLPNNELLPDIWSTGFMISPVFSTAFASINRMLNIMPNQTIGWLLIDEAGQATPQQAIGAIMRSKRVIAVGDPLQIEPIVTSPLPLLEGLSSFMGVNHIDWVAPEASVQTLADRANKYGALIDQGFSDLWIGSPLLVHRRCDDPMFTISNKLAYNGKMVKATQSKTTDVSQVFGGSTNWFDIKGVAQDKWCPASGDFITEKILRAIELKGESLDLFVISPFRIAAQNMQERILKERMKLSANGISNPNMWVSKNIGTVHTFQGREAETVIFLLGAPNDNQNGARNWAASSINLLNVAASRAKNNFYIVGNQLLWSETGKMPLIAKEIKKHIRNTSKK